MHSHLIESRLARFAAPATLALIFAIALPVWAATTQTFVPTTIQFPGATSTAARGINSNGDIVGSYACTKSAANPCTGISPGTHGFLLPAGSSTPLPVDVPSTQTLTVTGTLPRGISEQGVVVGQYSVSGGLIHGFACASPCSSAESYVFPIDVDGSLFDAAEAQAPSNSACTPGKHCPRDTLVVGINAEGDLVGCYHEDNATMTTMHGWQLRNGIFSELATNGGNTSNDPDTMNNGISPNHDVVGFYLTSGVSYIAHDNGITEAFTFPGNLFTLAWGVNAKGDVVGEHGDNQAFSGNMLGMCMSNCFDTNPVGFIRTKSGDYQSLAVQGANSTFVFGINASREIVGQYVDSTGAHGFVYRIAEGNGAH